MQVPVIVRRRQASLAAIAVGAVLSVVLVQLSRDEPRVPSDGACSAYVSTAGSDGASGSSSQPWRSIDASLTKVASGDVLCVQAGTYEEDVTVATAPQGKAARGITLRGVERNGEPPAIRGRLALVAPDQWTISGFRIIGAPGNRDDEALVSIVGGSGWTFEDNEVEQGNYAGVLVAASQTNGPPRDYTIRDNVVHDTRATNLYLNPSRFSTGGLVEHNLFYGGGTENVKLGWGGDKGCTGSNFQDFGIGGVTFRYNTLHGARRAALYVAEPGGLHDVEVYRNLFSGQPGQLVRYDSVEGCLGDRVFVHDNAGGLAPAFSQDFRDSPGNLRHERDNRFPVDPEYRSMDADGFRPGNAEAQEYGRYAHG